MNPISIQPATLNDVTTLTWLGETTFIETFAHLNTEADMQQYLAENFSVNQVTKELMDGNNKFFLAFWDRQPVAYMKLRLGPHHDQPQHTHALELERIYVLKDYLEKKIGATLLQHAIVFGQTLGYQTLWLGVWEHNERAINFYKRWGFTRYGSHLFILGSDPQTDILMKKDLTRTTRL